VGHYGRKTTVAAKRSPRRKAATTAAGQRTSRQAAARRDRDAPYSVAAVSRDAWSPAVSRTQTVYIACQLAAMVDSGVPLAQALESIASQCDKANVRAALQCLLKQVRRGTDLSAAVADCPYRFPRIFACLLRASEASGTMGPMLARVAEYLTYEKETVRKVRGALIYPAIMLCLAMAAAMLMFTVLLPRFELIYSQRQALLPLPTRVALSISQLMRAHWVGIVVVAVAASIALIVYFCSTRGRITIDWLKLHTPLISRMYRKFYLARSMQTISALIGSGLTVPEAVRLSHDITGNRYFVQLWDRVDQALQAGQPLAEPLFACPLVPNTVAQMIATGERTGQLAQMMEQVAKFCQSDLEDTIKNVTSLLEPLTIVVMGTIVGGIALTVLLPVFSLSKYMGMK